MSTTTNTALQPLGVVGVPWMESLVDRLSELARPARESSPAWRAEMTADDYAVYADPGMDSDQAHVASCRAALEALVPAAWVLHDAEDGLVDVMRLAELTGMLHAATPGPWILDHGREQWRVCDAGGRQILESAPWEVGLVVCTPQPDPADRGADRTEADVRLIAQARADIPWLAQTLAQAARRHAPDTAVLDQVLRERQEDGVEEAAALWADIGVWAVDDGDGVSCVICGEDWWPCTTLARIHHHLGGNT